MPLTPLSYTVLGKRGARTSKDCWFRCFQRRTGPLTTALFFRFFFGRRNDAGYLIAKNFSQSVHALQ